MISHFEFCFDDSLILNKEANTVALSYLWLIRKNKDIDTQKINLIINDGNEYDIKIPDAQDYICNIYVTIDLKNYIHKNEEDKRRKLYEVIFLCMNALCEAKSWDNNFFERVKISIIESGYIIPIVHIPAKKNKNNYAELIVDLKFDSANLILCVYNKMKQSELRINVFKAYPHPLIYNRFFDYGSWVSDDVYRIQDTEREIYFDCYISDLSVKINFNPTQNSITELNQLLLGLKYDTPLEERIKLLGLPRGQF